MVFSSSDSLVISLESLLTFLILIDILVKITLTGKVKPQKRQIVGHKASI